MNEAACSSLSDVLFSFDFTFLFSKSTFRFYFVFPRPSNLPNIVVTNITSLPSLSTQSLFLLSCTTYFCPIIDENLEPFCFCFLPSFPVLVDFVGTAPMTVAELSF